ncbi:hypothetical protein TNCV_3051851 [Trichonephila clavipes]|nr:hypothetical protein TNCV_3051851 [Trichonephila clavipes]
MTSARGHGAIVYCLNSRSEERQTGRHNSKGFVKGILETGGVMDKCVQMWTRNYGARARRLRRKEQEKGQESPGERERTEGGRKDGRERGGDGKRLKESRERESDARLEWRKGLSPEIGVKKTMNAGGVEKEI